MLSGFKLDLYFYITNRYYLSFFVIRDNIVMCFMIRKDS